MPVSYPPLDVTTFNTDEVIYVKGDADTDGSIRFVVDASKSIARIEKRKQGLFQPSSWKTGPNSLLLGVNITLSAIGHHLATETTDGHFHLYSHNTFDGELSTNSSTVPNFYLFVTRAIFQSDDSGEFTGLSISKIDAIVDHTISGKFYFKTGATAATDSVRIQTWQGSDDTGILIFDQTYPSSEFPADTEIQLNMDGFVEFEPGTNVFTTISSPATFSLKTDAAVLLPWLAADISFISNDDILQTFQWISGNNFDQGVLSIQDNKIYEANVTGVQSGTFDSNIDKWDQLISVQAFDKILISIDGGIVPNNVGNLVIAQ